MNENIEITLLIFLYASLFIAGAKLLMFMFEKNEY